MTQGFPWRPSASLQTIAARAQLYRDIRLFFTQRSVLEVEVPLLGRGATVDPYIQSLTCEVNGEARYLQTSPEFFLKRLLAAGSDSLYSLTKAFRQGERGRRHLTEFTLLEWYRVGWDEQQLLQECLDLLLQLSSCVSVAHFTYGQLFSQHTGLNPHDASLAALQAFIAEQVPCNFIIQHKSAALDLIFSHCIEPQLPTGIVCVCDYPSCQAALARLGTDCQNQTVAKRFEIFFHGMELANGYHELCDAAQLRQRFMGDQRVRSTQGLPEVPYDRALLAAMEQGLPDCAGVALGVDRLLMVLLQLETIDQVVSFVDGED